MNKFKIISMRSLRVFVMGLLCVGACHTNAQAATPPLHTSGHSILDADNNVVYLRGIGRNGDMQSASGMWSAPGMKVNAWDQKWFSINDSIPLMDATFQSYRDYWHVNMIRVFISAEWWWKDSIVASQEDPDNYPGWNTPISFRSYIETMVQEAGKYGIYVDFVPYCACDQYDYSGAWEGEAISGWVPGTASDTFIKSVTTGAGKTEMQFWESWWTSVVQRIGPYPNTIFEMWNEPGDTQSTYFSYMIDMYKTIRNTGNQNLIFMQWNMGFVPTWQELEWVPTLYNQLKASIGSNPANLVVTTHPYRYAPYPNLQWATTYSGVQAQLNAQNAVPITRSASVDVPLVFNEMGVCQQQCDSSELSFWDAILHNAKDMGIGVCAYYWMSDNDLGPVFAGESLTKGTWANGAASPLPNPVGQKFIDYAPAGGSTNNAPVLAAIGNKTVNEGSTLVFVSSATDIDVGDTLTYSASNLPSGATFYAATRTFSWTPSYTSSGTYAVTLGVSDSQGAADSEIITITVNDVNRAPAAPSVPSGSASGNTNVFYTYTSSTTDPDSDKIKYIFNWGDGKTSTTTLTNSGAVVSSTHAWAAAGAYSVKAQAIDSRGASSALSNALSVTIIAPDTATPSVAITSPSNGATVSGTVSVTGTASDNAGISKVEIAIDSGAFSPANGTSSWSFSLNTTNLSNGTHTISAKATDTSANTKTTSISVIKAGAGQVANLAYGHWSCVAHYNTGDMGQYNISHDEVGLSASGIPSLDNCFLPSEIFRGYCRFDSNGDYFNLQNTPIMSFDIWIDKTMQIEAGALDKTNGVENPASVLVADTYHNGNANTPPYNDLYGVRTEMSDDGAWIVMCGPSDKTLTHYTVDLRTLGIPLNNVAQIYFSFTALHWADMNWKIYNLVLSSDGGIDGTAPNVAITSPANGATVSGMVSVSGTASDNAGLSKVEVRVDGGTLASATGTSSWSYSLNTASLSNSSHTITALATDTSSNVKTTSIAVNVSNGGANHAPVLGSIGNRSVNENAALSFNLSATDADSDTLTYSSTGMPSGATLTGSNGAFTWTPTYSQSGSYNVAFTVSDGKGGSDSEAITITVNDVNRAPATPSVPSGSASGNTNVYYTYSSSTTDPDSDQVKYIFDWGDGKTSTSTFTNSGAVVSSSHSWTAANTYSVKVFAVDPNGGRSAFSSSSAVSITTSPVSDVTAPQVAVASPANNSTVAGTISVSGTASDNVALSKVEVRVDSGTYSLASGLAGWSYSFNTRTLSNGAHTIAARGTDTSSNSKTVSVTITTNNDFTGPVISAVNASNITLSSATITWATNETADTQVEYGLTTAYGSSTTLNASLVTSHSQGIRGLSPSILYHYRVRSKDTFANITVSVDHTFTTGAQAALSAQTPWSANQSGTLNLNKNFNYTMGYKFTPQKDGLITGLGGFFKGTANVTIVNSIGSTLVSASVTSTNTWCFTALAAPIAVTAGNTYAVFVYAQNVGVSYRTKIISLPQTYGDITILASCYAKGNKAPNINTNKTMYGQVDIQFVPNSGSLGSPGQVQAAIANALAPDNDSTSIVFTPDDSDDVTMSVFEAEPLTRDQVSSLPSKDSTLKDINIFRKITRYDDSGVEMSQNLDTRITLYVPYPDTDNNGVVDGTGIKEDTLKLFYFDENSRWVEVAETGFAALKKASSAGVETTDNYLVANIQRLGIFALMAYTPGIDLRNVIVYPNPYKPNSNLGHDKITFDGLTTGKQNFKIFTLSGRIINEWDQDAPTGQVTWNPLDKDGQSIPSGVYFYLITDPDGNKTKGKIAIIK
jgi:hypothetical protein